MIIRQFSIFVRNNNCIWKGRVLDIIAQSGDHVSLYLPHPDGLPRNCLGVGHHVSLATPRPATDTDQGIRSATSAKDRYPPFNLIRL